MSVIIYRIQTMDHLTNFYGSVNTQLKRTATTPFNEVWGVRENPQMCKGKLQNIERGQGKKH
jgi:hypothetical protein